MLIVACNGMDLECQLTGKYDEDQSIRYILSVRDILGLDKFVTVKFIPSI
jgi:hypothetical protein